MEPTYRHAAPARYVLIRNYPGMPSGTRGTARPHPVIAYHEWFASGGDRILVRADHLLRDATGEDSR